MGFVTIKVGERHEIARVVRVMRGEAELRGGWPERVTAGTRIEVRVGEVAGEALVTAAGPSTIRVRPPMIRGGRIPLLDALSPLAERRHGVQRWPGPEAGRER